MKKRKLRLYRETLMEPSAKTLGEAVKGGCPSHGCPPKPPTYHLDCTNVCLPPLTEGDICMD